jgi:hypothetical protein
MIARTRSSASPSANRCITLTDPDDMRGSAIDQTLQPVRLAIRLDAMSDIEVVRPSDDDCSQMRYSRIIRIAFGVFRLDDDPPVH